ncbi:hypothetical protein M8J76_001902 [Diaphorina citri]|nr:hypothetical protein M8J76_001902 [Diaphorina citri]
MADFTLDNLKNVSVPEENKENVEEYLKKMQTHYNAREAPNKSYRWQMSDFEVGCPLGTGKFGHVYLAKEKTTQIMIALKVLYKVEIINERMTHQVIRELEIQKHLNHPNIIRLYTYFHDRTRICLVLEFCAIGEMFTHMRKQPHQRYTEKDAAKYIYQVADAIHYCHQKKVIHRDIKPENLLLTMHEDVKISDFGWSVHAPSLHRKTMCGTLDYLPPEMVTSQHYGKEVDNWCIGILAYEFLVGKPPFESKDQDTTFAKIKALSYGFPSWVSDQAKDLVRSLLVLNPKDRLPLPTVTQHPWILNNYTKHAPDTTVTLSK